MTPGESVRMLRLAHNWTQTDLAQRSGLTQGEISAFERDLYKNPSYRTVQRLAAALGTDPSTLEPPPASMTNIAG